MPIIFYICQIQPKNSPPHLSSPSLLRTLLSSLSWLRSSDGSLRWPWLLRKWFRDTLNSSIWTVETRYRTASCAWREKQEEQRLMPSWTNMMSQPLQILLLLMYNYANHIIWHAQAKNQRGLWSYMDFCDCLSLSVLSRNKESNKHKSFSCVIPYLLLW